MPQKKMRIMLRDQTIIGKTTIFDKKENKSIEALVIRDNSRAGNVLSLILPTKNKSLGFITYSIHEENFHEKDIYSNVDFGGYLATFPLSKIYIDNLEGGGERYKGVGKALIQCVIEKSLEHEGRVFLLAAYSSHIFHYKMHFRPVDLINSNISEDLKSKIKNLITKQNLSHEREETISLGHQLMYLTVKGFKKWIDIMQKNSILNETTQSLHLRKEKIESNSFLFNQKIRDKLSLTFKNDAIVGEAIIFDLKNNKRIKAKIIYKRYDRSVDKNYRDSTYRSFFIKIDKEKEEKILGQMTFCQIIPLPNEHAVYSEIDGLLENPRYISRYCGYSKKTPVSKIYIQREHINNDRYQGVHEALIQAIIEFSQLTHEGRVSVQATYNASTTYYKMFFQSKNNTDNMKIQQAINNNNQYDLGSMFMDLPEGSIYGWKKIIEKNPLLNISKEINQNKMLSQFNLFNLNNTSQSMMPEEGIIPDDEIVLKMRG